MTNYLLNRILRSLFSIVIVVGVVMIMIYSALDRNLIFAQDAPCVLPGAFFKGDLYDA